ncbi:MAG: hypothetical protein ACXQT0_02210 [Candidatus Methanofastidiosia archaeon]
MYDTIEEIDEQLEELKKKRELANELLSENSYGTLIRGSMQKAGIKERERELLSKKKKLLEQGTNINFPIRIEKSKESLNALYMALKDTQPKHAKSILEMMGMLEKIKKELES